MDIKTLRAVFTGGSYCKTRSLTRQDYGIVLQFVHPDLPETYQVHFSNSKDNNGTAKPQIATADGVTIPDEYLIPGKSVYAWAFVQSEGTGRTRCMVEIPVAAKPTVTDAEPTPQQRSAIDEAIEALNDGVERSETAADKAEEATEHYPRIVNGYWQVWDVENRTWVDTGVKAIGDDGVPGRDGADGKDGADGQDGAPGVTYTPTVSADGEISWVNDGGLPNPQPRSIMGPKGETGATGPKGEKGDKGDTGPAPDMSAYRTAAAQDVIDEAQNAEIADLKSALNILDDEVQGSIIGKMPVDSTETKVLNSQLTSGYYWSNANGTATKIQNTTYKAYIAVDAQEVDIFYKIKVQNLNQNAIDPNVKSILIADEDYKILYEYTNPTDGYFDKEIILPNKAKYLLINYYNVSYNLGFTGYIINEVVDKTGVLELLFDSLYQDANGNALHAITNWTASKHWISASGKITSLENIHVNCKSTIVNINQESFYRINYGLYQYNPSSAPQGEWAIYICDENDYILRGYRTYPEGVFNIPAGGTKMYINAFASGDVPSGRYTLTEYSQNTLKGKKIAIIGDSISTNGNASVSGSIPNAVEITVGEDDVGKELHAYLTYYDVAGGLSLGGHTYTASEIGTDVTFIPTAEDVGKEIGKPNNYNNASTYVWWEVCADYFGFTPIPVCWSGSSICDHENTTVNPEYKCSWAWHESQIRKCGTRIPGTVNREAPDVIIVYRGCNDMTHSPYSVLTDDYFDAVDWSYPVDDTVSDNHGFKEGYSLLIKELREAYPNARIILCTMTVFKRVNYSHFPTNNGLYTLPKFNDAIREIADFFGCGVIEFDKCGITFENCYSEGYITDNATMPTHPNNKGHLYMGFQAIRDLKKIVT